LPHSIRLGLSVSFWHEPCELFSPDGSQPSAKRRPFSYFFEETHMSITLESFSNDVRTALLADPGPQGREQVRQLLEQVVQDEAFARQHLGDDQPQRRVLYQDPDLGFAILGHVFKEARRTQPHDHGDSWAIYGQVSGETTMDGWEIVEPAAEQKPGKVRLKDSATLRPGTARVYNEGEIHSPRREGPAKLIRIEGQPDQPGPGRAWQPV
jgi:predicted metal-dependent enzyme (double-stranded beta helix superfamily)